MDEGLTGGELTSIIAVIVSVLVLMYMVYQGNKKQEKDTNEKIAKIYNWTEDKLDSYVTEKVCQGEHKHSNQQYENLRQDMKEGFDRLSNEIKELKNNYHAGG